jgi:hypothetical protein
MPSKIASRPVEEKEKFFVNLFIREGMNPGSIAKCEKRAHLKRGDGKKILRRKSVKAELQTKTAPAREEILRQEIIGEAVVKAKAAQQEELAKVVKSITFQKLNREILIDQLMQGAVGLNWHMYPSEKLEVIKAALVLEQDSKTINGSSENTPGVYQSAFRRLAPPPASPILEPPKAQEGVFDLYPGKTVPPVELVATLPPIGESTEEAPEKPSSNPNVITVEIG